LEDSGSMAARAVWRMATRGGAKALGLHDVGTLRPGFSADLVLIDADLPTPLSAGNFFDQLLLWRDPQHVDAVMCAGQWLVRDGEILGVDEPAVRARCRQAAHTLWANA
jgi:cytosine/adenosine deaminase-related metal-dependent hydrolase